MKRCISTVWLRGACILSAILLGSSMGGALPTASGQTGDPTGAIADSSAPAPTGITITVPIERDITYNLLPGAISGPIAMPASQAVFVMGVNRTIGNRGVGQATLLSSALVPLFIEWTGVESPSAGPSALTDGFSGVLGTHILFIDFNHLLDIEVGPGANTIQLHNSNAVAQTGQIKLIY